MQNHLELAKGFCSSCWPVLVTLSPSSFLVLGQHDNGGTFLFPHHPPEVFRGVREGPLSGYVGTAIQITLHSKDRDKKEGHLKFVVSYFWLPGAMALHA